MPNTSTTNQRERVTIIEFLKEERTHIKMLKQLLEMADNNAAKLHSLFEDLPVNNNVNWGKSTGDQHCNRNNHCRHKMNDISATPSASRSNRCTAYNPHANESDYNDNETPDIADIYSEEVYNNIN